MVDLVAFGIILDDLVFPDGHTAMGMLGGGGPQTAFGMRLPALAGWSDQCSVGLVAGVGRDLPEPAIEWLKAVGVDWAGINQSDLSTPRAWQVLEADGRRTQVWRVPGRVVGAQLGRRVKRIPPTFRGARGFHLGIHPDEPDLEFIHQLRHLHASTLCAQYPIVSLEPFKPTHFAHPLSDEALQQLCSAADILSPNLIEAQSLVGDGSPDAHSVARRLSDAGARIVTLRMGAEGSLIYSSGTVLHVPVVPTTVIDPTGAGNAYCGGFLAGYIQTGNVLTAARYGAVAASFLVEQAGLPPITERLGAEANRRLQLLQQTGEVG